ncbi:hypothetical protein [Mycobacterium asiaticum]|uniref:hypothetical protein n=1 Tax=Mycobacterium asiaticum TaxID=1790 RepID=UPI00056079FC|nr:hypothetical protein [Mycobacterium asiaticum]ORA13577.1 hypothetical protein BST16_14005 [Mycobacterium asiaticum DSM 44297]
MAFTVRYQDHVTPAKDEFGDQATYQFLEGGVLKVVPPEQNAQVGYYPPTVWKSVVADKNHPPRVSGTVNPAIY